MGNHQSLQEAQATLFGMYQPDANKWVHLLHPLLNQALAVLGKLPACETTELEKTKYKIEKRAFVIRL